MKTNLWNGRLLRTTLQSFALTCIQMVALSMLAAALVLGGVLAEGQMAAAACVISFMSVFAGSCLAAKQASGKKLLSALLVGGLCLAVCLLARLLLFGQQEARLLSGVICILSAAILGGLCGSVQKTKPRRRRR